MQALYESGVRYLAPPLWVLVRSGEDGRLEPSAYAREARAARSQSHHLDAGTLPGR